MKVTPTSVYSAGPDAVARTRSRTARWNRRSGCRSYGDAEAQLKLRPFVFVRRWVLVPFASAPTRIGVS